MNCATKSCSGDGLKTLGRWLNDGNAEVLLLHNGRGSPLVLVSWDTWTRVARTVVHDASGWSNSCDIPDEPQQSGYSVLANSR